MRGYCGGRRTVTGIYTYTARLKRGVSVPRYASNADATTRPQGRAQEAMAILSSPSVTIPRSTSGPSRASDSAKTCVV
ncbi:hypothetical protein DAH74_17160 [Sphingomonas koreensis]|uniref:hypothetical protein n=1 Tax=Sphingomonas koreensis TaxID=93064 RepID=UPI000F7E3A7F|nr:hypothetical protein [Sphingomonas koreensis]MDC7808924.1 hypothetical protein [Sphingomonas koreensis]RSU79531.1 hypothetical protein DAH54_13065 [Sphingomonas koreensis]RSX03811.1 hypothetical protein DAI01_17350 [Sphingomonas koreensis]RSX09328.1 hypothetical protein DAI00_12085 [Sphingomonas koreensis]RSX21005.1 hypothetical protein DAH99_14830 [Sphingomonas koreensis]